MDQLLKPGTTVPITFEWQPKPLIKNYRVQVARDPRFEVLVLDQQGSGGKLSTARLPQGLFYWRVAVYDNTPVDSLWSSAHEFQLGRPAPQVVQPQGRVHSPPRASPPIPTLSPPRISKSHQQITLRFKTKSGRSPASNSTPEKHPLLQWQPLKGSTRYQIQISQDEEFSLEVPLLESNSNRFEWTSSKPGTHYWRVRGIASDGRPGPFSKTASLKIQLPPPNLLQAAIRKEILPTQLEKEGSVSHTISWNEVPKASGYQVMVSEDHLFKRTLATDRTSLPSFKFDLPREGTYHFKVAALDSSGQVASLYSNPSRVDLTLKQLKVQPIKLAVPSIQTPSDGTTIASSGNTRSPIVFIWTKVDQASQYKIQYSLSKDFSSIFYEKALNNDQFLLERDFPAGTIFWRVRAEKGSTNSSWTTPHSFEIPVGK